MKVVLDTNVLVSGVFFGGIPGKVLDLWSKGLFEIYVTPKILDEYVRVLSHYAGKNAGSLNDHWLAAIIEHAHHVLDPTTYPAVCRDPHDDKFFYCALSVEANYLITGDQDLKVLRGPYNFKIVSPGAFLSFLK